jgi:hypothetical protein
MFVYYSCTSQYGAFDMTIFWPEMLFAGELGVLGGVILLFRSGAGSDRKRRSHFIFDTPEHRAKVKERHKVKRPRKG